MECFRLTFKLHMLFYTINPKVFKMVEWMNCVILFRQEVSAGICHGRSCYIRKLAVESLGQHCES